VFNGLRNGIECLRILHRHSETRPEFNRRDRSPFPTPLTYMGTVWSLFRACTSWNSVLGFVGIAWLAVVARAIIRHEDQILMWITRIKDLLHDTGISFWT